MGVDEKPQGSPKPLRILVGERGFEPPTPWSRTRCSTRLSHSPTLLRTRRELSRVLIGNCWIAAAIITFCEPPRRTREAKRERHSLCACCRKLRPQLR